VAIAPTDIAGVDQDVARRVIAEARSIAPCLDSLAGEPRYDAIAIIKGIAVEGAGRGSRLIKSQRMGPGQVEYFDVASWFSAGDRAALRALCTDGSTDPVGLPVGSFPLDQPFDSIWPETPDYS
jgi:hypothetical protein